MNASGKASSSSSKSDGKRSAIPMPSGWTDSFRRSCLLVYQPQATPVEVIAVLPGRRNVARLLKSPRTTIRPSRQRVRGREPELCWEQAERLLRGGPAYN